MWPIFFSISDICYFMLPMLCQHIQGGGGGRGVLTGRKKEDSFVHIYLCIQYLSYFSYLILFHSPGLQLWLSRAPRVPVFTLFVISCEKKLNSHWIIEILQFYIMSETHREKNLEKAYSSYPYCSLSEDEIFFFSCGNTLSEYIH